MNKISTPVKIIAVLGVLAICVAIIFMHGQIKEPAIIIDEPPVQTEEKLYTLETYPMVDASLATQPLTNAFITNFTDGEAVIDNIEYTNTHPAYEKLIKGEADLIVVTQPSEEELALASEKNVDLEVIPVVNEGFVFYVNKDNPVNSLTTEQIQKIYAGEITNWKEVGGNDEKIIPYQRPVNSGSQTGMLALVMKDYDLMEAPKENLISTMEEIVNLVSAYDNGPNAIGYSYYYYATTMYETIDSSVANNIKFIAINDVQPNNDTIASKEYPYTTAYYIVINKADAEDSPSRILANQMISERGQKVAENAGYVPAYKFD